MSKFLYPIYKLKTKSYIKWWLYHKKAGGSGVLSEILEGFSFNLENTLNRKFNLFEIQGNSVQDGTPSPDNEVPILSAGDNGSINEKVQNKNFFDIEKAVERFENWVGDSRSDWGTYENGVVNIVKSNGAHGYYGFAGQKFAFNKGASCTLSAEVLLEGTNSASSVRIGVEEREKDNTSIGSAKNIDIAKNKWTHITIIVSFTEAVTNARVQIEAANTGNTVQIKNIQLEQGSTATPYVEHEEQTLSFPLAENLPFYEDAYFEKENSKWYVVNFYKYFEYPKISKMDRFTIRDKTTLVSFFDLNMNLQLKTYNYDCMSNAFIPKDVYNTDQTGVFVHATSAGYAEYVYFGIPNELNLTTKQKAYDWLKENVTLLYPLEVPEKVEITDTTLINQLENLKNVKTYKGGTIISSEDETPAYLKIQYYKEG